MVELALALAVSALLVAGAVAYYNNANAERLTRLDAERIVAIRAAVEQLYSGQPDYSALTTDQLVGSRILPNSMIKGSNRLVNVWGGDLQVTAEYSNNQGESQYRTQGDTYIVISFNVPQEGCVRLITKQLGARRTYVNGQPIRIGEVYLDPIPLARAVTACSNNRNRIHWDF